MNSLSWNIWSARPNLFTSQLMRLTIVQMTSRVALTWRSWVAGY